jgi:glycine cleavage system transcriptional repressor
VNEIVVTAVGADRPGIVAAITGALLELGGNLEETRAALLRGSFATVLAVAVPDGVGREEVQAALRPVALELGLGLWGGDAAPRAEAVPLARAVVSVYGADHPGIVHAMAVALAGAGANIVDLSSRLVGDPAIYVLGIQVELPPGGDADALRGALAPVAATSGVELAIELEDDEVL